MTTYDKLNEIMASHPDLIFNNDGYENLPQSVVEAHKDVIEAITNILKSRIKGFVRFQNFKPYKDGSVSVRYQVHYNDEGSFTGVAYTPLSAFKEAV